MTTPPTFLSSRTLARESYGTIKLSSTWSRPPFPPSSSGLRSFRSPDKTERSAPLRLAIRKLVTLPLVARKVNTLRVSRHRD